MIIKYKVTTYSIKIEQVKVEKETASTVYIVRHGGRFDRENKVSNYHAYFDTYAEAKAHIIERINRRIAGLKDGLAQAESDLEKAKQL